MNSLFALPAVITLVLSVVTFAMQAFAFVDAISHPPQAFEAADKLTKPAWLIFTGLGLLWHMIFFADLISIVNLLGIVAAIVYLVDVRPAIKALR